MIHVVGSVCSRDSVLEFCGIQEGIVVVLHIWRSWDKLYCLLGYWHIIWMLQLLQMNHSERFPFY